jgi:hypothetical protein
LQYFIQNMTTVYKPVLDIVGDNSNDRFGGSVSASDDGTIVAVGAAVGNYVKIYKNTGTEWVQIGATINGEAAGDESGTSVSLSADGTVVAIGATLNDGVNGADSGHVRVFKWTYGNDYTNLTNDLWTKIGVDIYGNGPGDELGHSVSLSSDGTIVAIGSVAGSGSGRVMVYKWTYGNDYSNPTTDIWTKIGVNIYGEASGDQSGYSVSLSADGTVVAIGARINDGVAGNDSGHVRVHKWTHGNDYTNHTTDIWTKIGVDIDGEANNDYSGYSVSLSDDGTVVAIGAALNNDGGANSGHVRVFKWTHGDDYTGPTTDTWAQIGVEIDGEANNDFSGCSVSLSADGTVVAIGAIGVSSFAGHVRVFRWDHGTDYSNHTTDIWTKIGDDIDGVVAGDAVGSSVSLSADGSTVASGADGVSSFTGHVGVFKYHQSNWNQNLLSKSAFINVSGGVFHTTGNGAVLVE